MKEIHSYDERLSFLWAKNSVDPPGWLPLYIHSADTLGVIRKLWDEWIGKNTKERIIDGTTLGNIKPSDSTMGAIISFIGACHDIGKASPVFQVKIRNEDRLNLLSRIENSSLKLRDDLKKSELSHSIISELIMERNGIDTSVSIVIGGHHGAQPTKDQLNNASFFPNHSGFNDVDW